MNLNKIFAIGFTVTLPLLSASAVFAQNSTAISKIISSAQYTLNLVIGLLFSVATLVFLWGMVQFIAKSGDATARNKAKGIMTWGIIGLAVITAAWGVVYLLSAYFGFS